MVWSTGKKSSQKISMDMLSETASWTWFAWDIPRPVTIANGSSSNPLKSEKEEGELSLNGDFDESSIRKGIEADGDDDDSENRVHDVDNNDVSGSDSGVWDIPRPVTIANGSSSNPSKSEKEEGELSLNGYFDESNIRKGIEADGDDDDSENRVHDGNNDDVLGSDSGGKAECEGEVADATNVSGDGMHYARTSKPLAKCVASLSSCGREKKDDRVFYGSDVYYTLFRLHQVMEVLMSLQGSQMETDDFTTSYMLQVGMGWTMQVPRTRLPYMNVFMPPLLQFLQLEPGVIITSADSDNKIDEADDERHL
nr:histone deacetylase interacting domain, Sin3 [Tanacetum cinerariifolium]